MGEWKIGLKEKLMSFDFPIEVEDLCRLTGCSLDNTAEMLAEIAQITKSLEGTEYALVVEEGKCSSCFRSVRFTGKLDYTCSSCGGYVSPPKVCINPR